MFNKNILINQKGPIKIMKKLDGESKEKEFINHLDTLSSFVRSAAAEGMAAHKAEAEIWDRILKIGREMFGTFLELQGDGDMGPEIKKADGDRLKRFKKPQIQKYQSIFGEFEIKGTVYGKGEGKKIEYAPVDSRLQLPKSKFSYMLQDWNQYLSVEMPYAKVNGILRKILGFSQSVDSLERNNRQMASYVPDFWENLETPPEDEEGCIVVATADGKGVPIRKAVQPSDAPSCLSGGEPKSDQKKMSIVGSVYTVDRYVRTQEDVLSALFRDSKEDAPRDRPRPAHKRVRASLKRDEDGKSAPSVEEIFGWMGKESRERNPESRKPAVLLMDGQESLWKAGREHLPGKNITEVLDLLHAASYAWDAACLFHPSKSKEAEKFAKHRIKRILNGDAAAVIQGLRRMGTSCKFKGAKLRKLNQICGYFQNNLHRMKYDEYIEAGYPIASGVIEGACRNLVKDRMERSGMRWVLDGANSMLALRSVFLGNLWNEFLDFRIKKEAAFLYKMKPANDYPCYSFAVNS